MTQAFHACLFSMTHGGARRCRPEFAVAEREQEQEADASSERQRAPVVQFVSIR